MNTPSNISVTGNSSQTGSIVYEWLHRIGLGYAVKNFRRRKIDTPQALIGLTFQDYDDLEISVLADRKRLFELVQRVRMAARAVKRKSGAREKVSETTPDWNYIAKSVSPQLSEQAKITPDVMRVTSHRKNKNAATAFGTDFHVKKRQSNNIDGDKSVSVCRLVGTPSASGSNTKCTNEETMRPSLVDKALLSAEGNMKGCSKENLNGPPHHDSNPSKIKSILEQIKPNYTKTAWSDNKSSNVDSASKIRVVVRKRPLSRQENMRGDIDVIEIQNKDLILHEPRVKVDMTRYVESHSFAFDETFDEKASNSDVYERTCKPLVAAVLGGAKATCFAYGQTGSGKTYTMMGPDADGRHRLQHLPGLYELAVKDMFAQLSKPTFHHIQICVAFFEIYGGKLFDLLNGRRKLRCLEDGKKQANIVGLRRVSINEVGDLFKLMERGHDARSTGTTGANLDSSRSHAVLQIMLKNSNTGKGCGKFSFIDLAGSERGQDTTHADRQTRMEGAEINKSLLALKECIRALYHEQDHTPFRGSKLTQVLKDSFTGNGRTVMVVTISPNMGNCEHTLNTLRYGYRVKEIGKDTFIGRRSNVGTLDLNRDSNYMAPKVADASETKLKRAMRHKSDRSITGVTKIVEVSSQQFSRPRTQVIHHGRHIDGNGLGDIVEEDNASIRPMDRGVNCIKKKPFTSPETMSNTQNISNAKCDRRNHMPSGRDIPAVSVTKKIDESNPNNFHKSTEESFDHPSSLGSGIEMGVCHRVSKINSNRIEVDNIDISHSSLDVDLSHEHLALVSAILSEEEELVASHREHIHSMMNLVKKEMSILNSIDMPGAKTDEYATLLGDILDKKIELASSLKMKLESFKLRLNEEETLHSSIKIVPTPQIAIPSQKY